MDNLIIILISCLSMTTLAILSLGLFIYLIVRSKNDSKKMLTRLTESNETLFQMKDATDSSFIEFQLHMDRRLKSHVVYQKPILKTVYTQTNETIVEVEVHCHRNEIAENQSCPPNETIVEVDVQCHRNEIAEKQSGPTFIGSEERTISSDVIIVIEEIASDPE